ncbi:MAG: TetR/AcrR family transcriptional regulator [Acidimicrobiales bacterium]
MLSHGGGVPPTTTAVQRAAAVSRGALLHPVPTRTSLLAAAVASLRAGNREAVEAALAATSSDDPIERAVRSLAAAAVRPEMSAEYGLWSAARVDEDLRQALRTEERNARDSLDSVIDHAFGEEITGHPDYPRAVALTIQFLRGLSVTHSLRNVDERTDALLEDWTGVLRTILAP